MRVATIPHAMVSVGSQNLGVVRLRMMLHGICLWSTSRPIKLELAN